MSPKSSLVEQAPEFTEVGAGLQMAPNATRLLKRWGLLDEALASGVAPRRLVFRDATPGEGLLEQGLTDEFSEYYGAPYIVAHRADLPGVRWGTVFGDDNMAAAVIDRIVHHGRLLHFRGESLPRQKRPNEMTTRKAPSMDTTTEYLPYTAAEVEA